MQIIKYLVSFLLFFFLFYIEPLTVGGIKFSLIWKVFLFLPMILYIITRNNRIRSGFITAGYVWGVKNVFTFSLIKYPAETLLLSLKAFNLAFIYHYLKLKEYNSEKLVTVLTAVSSFVIVSSIPFHLNLLEPIGQSYRLNIYDSSENSYAYVGIFQNAHAASIITALSLLSIMYLSRMKRRKYYIPLILLGFLNLYYTYVRTGYLIFAAGIIFLLFIHRKEYRLFIKSFAVILVLVCAGLQLYKSNPLILDRILNITKYSALNLSTLESIGSGRTLFWITNLDIWFYDLEPMEQIVGVGEEIGKDLLKKRMGMRIFSHNGFVDALLQNGLAGFFVFTGFIFYFYKELRKNRNSTYFGLGAVSFLSYLILHIVQGGYFFLFDLLIALNLSLTAAGSHIPCIKKPEPYLIKTSPADENNY